MTDLWTERDDLPAFEVRVLHTGDIVHRELCETTEQAALVADQWGDRQDTTVEIIDLRAPAAQRAVDDVELYDTQDSYDGSGGGAPDTGA